MHVGAHLEPVKVLQKVVHAEGKAPIRAQGHVFLHSIEADQVYDVNIALIWQLIVRGVEVDSADLPASAAHEVGCCQAKGALATARWPDDDLAERHSLHTACA